MGPEDAPDRSLANRVAIVTGAARGIGKAVALELARAGAHVVVAGRSEVGSAEWPGSIHATVDEIRAAEGTAIAVRCDVNVDDDIDHLVRTTTAELGPIDLVVNNAALMGFGVPFLDGDVAYLERAWHANVRAPYVLSLAAARAMGDRGGAIVNISSGASRHPVPIGRGGAATTGEHDRDPTVYSLTKAALDRMSTGMAHELHRHGIAVVAVHPGFILTERLAANPRDGMDLSRAGPATGPAKVVAHIARDPMRYTGEIISAGAFLAEHDLPVS